MEYEPLEQMILMAKWCDNELTNPNLKEKYRLEVLAMKAKMLDSMTPYRHPKRRAMEVGGMTDAPPIQHAHEFNSLSKEAREALRNGIV